TTIPHGAPTADKSHSSANAMESSTCTWHPFRTDPCRRLTRRRHPGAKTVRHAGAQWFAGGVRTRLDTDVLALITLIAKVMIEPKLRGDAADAAVMPVRDAADA